MRIMLLAGGGDIGGAKTHILNLAKELSKKNEVLLVSLRKGPFADEAVGMGINTVALDHRRTVAYAIHQTKARIEIFAPQLIHCHGSKANMIGAVLKGAYDIPVITTVHSDPRLDYIGKPFRQYTFGVINAVALRRLNAHVAVAGEMKKLLISRGFDPFNVYTIYNGIDFDGSENAKRVERTKDVINVGIAARLNPVKDIETIIRAFALAYEQDKRLRLLIAGTGEEEDKLKKLSKDLGVENLVSFEGWRSDVKSFFEKIDINVLSSLSETFPYSLLEGAYMHCPVIASNAGGIPYLIKHEKTGLLFECKDVETFSKYILQLAADEELRNRLGENLYQFAKENFSLSAMALQQEKIYQSVLKRSENDKRHGVVICGAYGRGNAGDEAILKSIISELRSVDEDIPLWVMTRNPNETRNKHQERGIYIFNPLSLIKALKHSKFFISGGGSLIQDVTSSRSLYFYLYLLGFSKRYGCKVLMYGCGIGPIIKKKHESIVASVINSSVDVITLRDTLSYKLLSSIGVNKPRVIVTADPAFGLEPSSEEDISRAFKDENIPSNIKMMGLCLRKWDTFDNYEAVANAITYAYRKYGLAPVFLSVEIPHDIPIAEDVAKLLPSDVPRYICRNLHQDSEFIGMLSKMEVVCGMRLHSLIFATVAGVSTIALSYDVKVDGLFHDFKNEAIVDVSEVAEKALKTFIDDAVVGSKVPGRMLSEKVKAIESNNVIVLREFIGA